MKGDKKRPSLSRKVTGPLALGVVATCAALVAVLSLLVVSRENSQLVTRGTDANRLLIEALTFSMSNGVTDIGPLEDSLRGFQDIVDYRVLPLPVMSSGSHAAPDPVEAAVFAGGGHTVSFEERPGKGRILRVTDPMAANETCLACHPGIAAGQVVAVTSIYFSTAGSRAFVRGFATQAVLLALASILLLIAIVWLALRLIVIRPLHKMRDLVGDIAHGQGDLTRRVSITSADEVGEVAGLVDSFIDQTHSLVLGIRTTTSRSSDNAAALAAASERAHQSATAAKASIDSTQSLIAELNEQNAVVSASAQGILQGIRSLGERIDDQSSSVIQSSAAIRQMSASTESVARVADRQLASAKDLVVVTRRGGEKVGEVDREIADISKSIDDIGQAIALINGIAKQTNLLSMNAAIEAAHAGDYGAGFAVVAEEIRGLAESSARNAKQVTAVLKDIITRIRQALLASRESSESLARIGADVEGLVQAFTEIAGSTRELAEGGKEVLEASEALRDATEVIRQGSIDMGRSAENIVASHGKIDRISGLSTAAMEEVAARAAAIDGDMVEITELGAEGRRVGEELVSAVGRFKVDEGAAPRAGHT